MESTNGEGDHESTTSTQKSPSGSQKSPANSSISSQAGGEKNESSSSVIFQETPKAESSINSSNLPQNFSRVCNDQESTCARTDLVYVHPPPEEKPSAPKVNLHIHVCAPIGYIGVLFSESLGINGPECIRI